MDSYEQKYKEALERAKAMIKVAANQDEAIGFANTIFPELKESEDEIIRKSLLDYLHTLPNHFSHDGSLVIDWIAWLEKQGEQILANSAKTCKDEQEPTDEEMKTLLRTEYEKGKADVIAEIQNPAWSEEDECYMSECIGAIATKDGWSFEEKRKTKHWLKSLKDRVQPRRRHTIFDEII